MVDSKSTDKSSVFNGINKVIRILSLDAQKCIIDRTLKIKTHTPEDNIFFTITPNRCHHCGSVLPIITPVEVSPPIMTDISINSTISFPWDDMRLLKNFIKIKIGQANDNPFIYNESNHFSNLLVSPINLFITGNGYHSTTAGIYDINAISYAQYTLDISPLYDKIFFDGIAFRHISCNCILESPQDKSIGTIYEIGRLLLKHNLNLLNLMTAK